MSEKIILIYSVYATLSLHLCIVALPHFLTIIGRSLNLRHSNTKSRLSYCINEEIIHLFYFDRPYIPLFSIVLFSTQTVVMLFFLSALYRNLLFIFFTPLGAIISIYFYFLYLRSFTSVIIISKEYLVLYSILFRRIFSKIKMDDIDDIKKVASAMGDLSMVFIVKKDGKQEMLCGVNAYTLSELKKIINLGSTGIKGTRNTN